MPGNAPRRPNQANNGPAVASLYLGFGRMLGPMMDDGGWSDGPKYRNTNTSMSSKCTCFDSPDSGEGPWAAGMIPSPLGRGLPSRHGYNKSY
jgi:hypothetical protein